MIHANGSVADDSLRYLFIPRFDKLEVRYEIEHAVYGPDVLAKCSSIPGGHLLRCLLMHSALANQPLSLQAGKLRPNVSQYGYLQDERIEYDTHEA